jgi:hypothetical protein
MDEQVLEICWKLTTVAVNTDYREHMLFLRIRLSCLLHLLLAVVGVGDGGDGGLFGHPHQHHRRQMLNPS